MESQADVEKAAVIHQSQNHECTELVCLYSEIVFWQRTQHSFLHFIKYDNVGPLISQTSDELARLYIPEEIPQKTGAKRGKGTEHFNT